MRRLFVAVFAIPLCAAAVGTAQASPVPILNPEVAAGGGTTVPLRTASDPPRTVDGYTADWTGRLPGFGGALDYSRGELVYEDHVFDAYGADNGQDAQRMAIEDPLEQAVPETYRIDPAIQYVPQEFGIPTGPFTFDTHYGDVPHVDQADLSEVRLGTDPDRNLWLLARTTTMDDTKPATALLVLLDTNAGTATHSVPFNSGLTTTTAETALFLTGSTGFVADLSNGHIDELPPGSVATNATGYDNGIEARIPAALLRGAANPGVAVAAGIADASGKAFKTLDPAPNVANVAFRTHEPARDWWDKQQALTLQQGTIDPFFTTADLAAMAAGANERYAPGPGYHDRVFHSSPTISNEHGDDGILQHYGVYIPTSYRAGTPSPVQWWFHFRGGNAHIAAAVAPGILEQMGEDADSIVVTPDGRGTSRWYVGKGQVDYLEVWRDVHRLLTLDRNREYIAGHSMGGWASWLLPILYPDRWAAAFPASGPLTQGLWVGCTNDDRCWQSANDGREKDEWTTPLLENLRWVPYANYQGAADELVFASGVTAQMQKMHDLGFRYEYFVYPHEEHYGPPVFDQWAEGVKYEHEFVRDPNPPSLTYIRSMPMEHAVEQVQADKVPLDFDFDHAYWMSDLQPVDQDKGTARFDGRSLAIPELRHDIVPVAGGPASADQLDPYVMEGQAWKYRPGTESPRRNAFVATLTGARSVALNMRRMRIQTSRTVSGDITTQAPLRLELLGKWAPDVTASLDGASVPVERISGGIAIDVPAGHHRLVTAAA
jgi:pimeloyl-ACP methyl ester carboxylesterase